MTIKVSSSTSKRERERKREMETDRQTTRDQRRPSIPFTSIFNDSTKRETGRGEVGDTDRQKQTYRDQEYVAFPTDRSVWTANHSSLKALTELTRTVSSHTLLEGCQYSSTDFLSFLKSFFNTVMHITNCVVTEKNLSQ